jgi:MinD superfamily P-loop ATPase
MEWQWRLIQQECTGCGICADVCRYDAILMTTEMAYPVAVPAACVGCMECAQQCPFDAIEVEEVSSSAQRNENPTPTRGGP